MLVLYRGHLVEGAWQHSARRLRTLKDTIEPRCMTGRGRHEGSREHAEVGMNPCVRVGSEEHEWISGSF